MKAARWKPLLAAIYKVLLSAEEGQERKKCVRIDFPHFQKRPRWLPEGKRVKLLDKSAVWEYNAYLTLANMYKARMTKVSPKELLRAKRGKTLKEIEEFVEVPFWVLEGI